MKVRAIVPRSVLISSCVPVGLLCGLFPESFFIFPICATFSTSHSAGIDRPEE